MRSCPSRVAGRSLCRRRPTTPSRRCRTRESARQRSLAAQGTPHRRASRYLNASFAWFPPFTAAGPTLQPHPRPETLALFVIPSPLTSASTNRSSERWPFIDQRTDRLTRWRNPNQLECPLLTQADIACAPPNVRFQG